MTADIGYSVVSRETVALVLGGAAIGLLAVGLVVRRSRRPGLTGWLGPVVMVVAAGAWSRWRPPGREAVPPTAASPSCSTCAPGTGDAAATGLFAVYRPESGPVDVGRPPTAAGSTWTRPGSTGRRAGACQTDLDAWHWDGLSLPAGVRTGPFRATRPDRAPCGRSPGSARPGSTGR